MGMASTAVGVCVAEPDLLVAHAKELTAENGEMVFGLLDEKRTCIITTHGNGKKTM